MLLWAENGYLLKQAKNGKKTRQASRSIYGLSRIFPWIIFATKAFLAKPLKGGSDSVPS